MTEVDRQAMQFFLNALACRLGLRLDVRDEGSDVVCEVFERDERRPEAFLRLVGVNATPVPPR